MTLPDTGIPKHQDILVFLHELPRRELEDKSTVEAVEAPVERIQRFTVAKSRFFDPSFDKTVASSLHFIVDQKPEEIEGAESIGPGLLRANAETVRHTAEAQLPQRTVKFVMSPLIHQLISA